MATKNSTASAATSPDDPTQPEIQEPDPATTPETQASGSAGSGSGGINGSARGSQDGSEGESSPEEPHVSVPQEPEVVFDATGQHVNVPQEDGSVKTVYTRAHTMPVTNGEQQKYELTHRGDQPRYPYVPGDAGYSPYSDPTIPDSRSARHVQTEILSYPERVQTDKSAAISPMWNSFRGIYNEELADAIATGGGGGKVQV